ncbi:MAG: L-histidine N(alpha)-methyltransferase, partial [Pseudomonadota bacterium]|nr:L-histidine N(alpha)-methyltransferase [Pseudomonadota bacterium]
TAAFNMNLLTRINRELGGTIPADAFAHEARWNDDLARIEMHLVATRDVAFEVSGERFTMQRGETIHTENSHKFTPRTASLLLLAGGWTPLERWTDAKDQFSVLLARATDQREAP